MLLASVLPPLASAQTATGSGAQTTLKSEMEILHQIYGVNFVYDSSIALDLPYKGKPMRTYSSLEAGLEALFTGSGIEYEIMKKYVVLTKAGAKKKPKDYTIFIEEQHDTINESVITALVDPKRNSTQKRSFTKHANIIT